MKINCVLLNILFCFIGCKSEEISPNVDNTPTVIINESSELTYRSIKLNAEVTNEGYSAATERGFVYSNKNTIPSVSDSRVISGFGKGKYYITLDNLPINTTYFVRAFSTNSKGTNYSNVITFNTPNVKTVTSITGKVWMDRNLGATQVAASINDEKSFGDLYQWGREQDGHQIRNSTSIEFGTITNNLNKSSFITNPSYPYDWQVQKNDDTWQGVNGSKCPCPVGFRLPTSAEWISEVETWATNDANGAFNSKLKLPAGGVRKNNGSYSNVGIYGFYWSSSAWYGGVNTDLKYSYLSYGLLTTQNGAFGKWLDFRASGLSVRCIKD